MFTGHSSTQALHYEQEFFSCNIIIQQGFVIWNKTLISINILTHFFHSVPSIHHNLSRRQFFLLLLAGQTEVHLSTSVQYMRLTAAQFKSISLAPNLLEHPLQQQEQQQMDQHWIHHFYF
jgi:hypothetical protein